MTKRYFITGTDTDVGKTYITQHLLQSFPEQSTLGLKPLALGAEMTADGLRNDDALILQSASTIQATYADINPFVYDIPAAPHIALNKAGISLTASQIIDATNQSIEKYQPDLAFIEGAGGFAVPISADQSMVDVAQGVCDEVILVVGLRLGCLNHAILTYDAIVAAGLNCRYWIANQIYPEMLYQNENIDLLQQRLPAKYLGQVLFGSRPKIALE